jgi:hypothetical protein
LVFIEEQRMRYPLALLTAWALSSSIMHADNRAMLAESTTDMPVKRRRHAPVIGRIDHRTKQGRRVAQLIEHFTSYFGGADKLTPVQRMNIARAAELTALSEAARGAALRAPIFDIENLTRLESTADRAIRRLALPDKPSGTEPDLHTYLRQRAAEEVTADAVSDVPEPSTPSGHENRTSEATAELGEAAQ